MSLRYRTITRKETAEFERFTILPPLDSDELLKTKLGSIPTGNLTFLLNYPQELHREIDTIADNECLSAAYVLRSFLALKIRIDHQKNKPSSLACGLISQY